MGNAKCRKMRLDAGLCVGCGKLPPLPGKRECPACRDKTRDRQRKRYWSDKATGKERKAALWKSRKEAGLCPRCGNRPPMTSRVLCQVCTHKLDVYSKTLKDEVFAKYGGYRCACCGESNPGFLTIDHIDNDGADDRRLHGSGRPFYKWVKASGFPPTLQVLCYNCNCGRARNGGVCPHKLGVAYIPA